MAIFHRSLFRRSGDRKHICMGVHRRQIVQDVPQLLQTKAGLLRRNRRVQRRRARDGGTRIDTDRTTRVVWNIGLPVKQAKCEHASAIFVGPGSRCRSLDAHPCWHESSTPIGHIPLPLVTNLRMPIGVASFRQGASVLEELSYSELSKSKRILFWEIK